MQFNIRTQYSAADTPNQASAAQIAYHFGISQSLMAAGSACMTRRFTGKDPKLMGADCYVDPIGGLGAPTFE